MEERPKKKRGPKWPMFLVGYGLGTFSWILGLHCLDQGKDGNWKPVLERSGIHCSRVFSWAAGLSLFSHGFHQYFLWLMVADPEQKILAILCKTVLFLYIRLFWPEFLTRILPGLKGFFCPQCYAERVFRFMPVSSNFGNWVTYLCPHCSCLVDAWGGQIFYPQKSGSLRWAHGWILLPAGVLVSLGLGISLGELLIKTF